MTSERGNQPDLILYSVVAEATAAAQVDGPPRVSIDTGTIEGTIDSTGVLVFRGIPYD